MKEKLKIGGICLFSIVAFLAVLIFWRFQGDAENNILKNTEVESKTEKIEHAKEVLVKVSENVNYVIYIDEYGTENVIEKASIEEAPWGSSYVGDHNVFSEARFSPKKNYILYKKYVYEVGNVVFLYDIVNKKTVEGISGVIVDFTPDERYLYACRNGNVFASDQFSFGKVYETAEFKEIYSVFGKTIDGNERASSNQETEFFNEHRVESCRYENNYISFNLQNPDYPNDSWKNIDWKYQDSKIVYFDLESQKATEKYYDPRGDLIIKQIN